MRSSWTLRLLQRRSRPSHRIQYIPLHNKAFRNSYCSACEPETPIETKATTEPISTTNPPTPSADHRQLAIEQELYINSPYAPGSPIFLPNGTRIFNRLSNNLRSQYIKYGFEEVITPSIYKKSLWEKSGHWEQYADDMYTVTGRGATGQKEGRQANEDEEYGLKPMNCPGHCLIFASKKRSYRDLPIRYADFSPLHRNEIHGALSGLTRVRRFHQDDGHIFCRPSQIRHEIAQTLDFVQSVYRVLGLGPYRLALSTRPAEGSIGTAEEWTNAEVALKEALEASKQQWTINEGDGAFYGPKIDIILKDSDGKEHQTATIQLDFQLPKRFELEYQAPAPELEQQGLETTDAELLKAEGPVTPVLIHRAVLGSVERIMALLIEHHKGYWPYWLNPNQMAILTVNDTPKVVEFAEKTKLQLQSLIWKESPTPGQNSPDPPRIDVDSRPISLNKKISEAKRKRYSLIAVVGKNDVEHGELVVDFSGIKNEDFVRSLFTLRIAESRREMGLHGSHRGPKIDYNELPLVSTNALKSFRIKTKALKDVLERLQREHQ